MSAARDWAVAWKRSSNTKEGTAEDEKALDDVTTEEEHMEATFEKCFSSSSSATR